MLKDCIENVKKAAKNNFLSNGYLTPVFISDFSGTNTIMPLFFRGPEDKEEFSNQLQHWIANGQVKEYIMVNESWYLKESSDNSSYREWIKTHGSLEHHPNRKEAIMIQYCSPSEEISLIAEIKRDAKAAELGDWEVSGHVSKVDPVALSSRFNGLFAKSSAELN